MAGSSNFVQHNPTEANQEDDATFGADSFTTGGIPHGPPIASVWMNKRWYQDSTMVAALGLMLANKGYHVSDADMNVLATVLGNLVTEADLKAPLVLVNYSPTPTFPASTADGFDLTLGGNVTSSTLDSVNVGQKLTFVITQNSGGGLTFVPPAAINAWQPINPAPNAVTVQQFIVKEDGTIWPVAAPLKPLSVNDVTGARSFGAIFQNTTNSPITVVVSGSTNSGVGHTASIQGRIGSGSPSVNVATSSITNSSGATSITMLVPAGSFYGVYTAFGFPGDNTTAQLLSWIEYTNS